MPTKCKIKIEDDIKGRENMAMEHVAENKK